MADGNGNGRITWQAFATVLLLIIGSMFTVGVGVAGYVLKDMNDNVKGLKDDMGTVKNFIANKEQNDTRRDTQLHQDRTDIDELKGWHNEWKWNQEHAQHRRDVNQLEKKNRRKEIVVREKTIALKLERKHGENVAKKLTDDLVKGAPSAEATP